MDGHKRLSTAHGRIELLPPALREGRAAVLTHGLHQVGRSATRARYNGRVLVQVAVEHRAVLGTLHVETGAAGHVRKNLLSQRQRLAFAPHDRMLEEHAAAEEENARAALDAGRSGQRRWPA